MALRTLAILAAGGTVSSSLIGHAVLFAPYEPEPILAWRNVAAHTTLNIREENFGVSGTAASCRAASPSFWKAWPPGAEKCCLEAWAATKADFGAFDLASA